MFQCFNKRLDLFKYIRYIFIHKTLLCKHLLHILGVLCNKIELFPVILHFRFNTVHLIRTVRNNILYLPL